MIDKDQHREDQESSIKDYLRKRAEIEQAIRDRFERELVILFTDIVASTEFYEKHGDIQGRALIQRHNDLLTPIVEKHGGLVVKTTGDGFMASFEDPREGARAAIEMQSTLAAFNQEKGPLDQLWIKIGIHHGSGIVEQEDVYGDVANTTARICSLAQRGDILISQAYADIIRDAPDIAYDYVGVRNVRGKAAPLEIYRILWDPSQQIDLKRSLETESFSTYYERPMLRLVFSLMGEHIHLVTHFEHSLSQATRHIQDYLYRELDIRTLVDNMNQCLSRMDSRGRLPRDDIVQLKDLGRNLHGLLIPAELTEFIRNSGTRVLLLHLDDALEYIPWELLYTEDDFFCLRYSMGRIVSSTRQPLAQAKTLTPGQMRMLIVADPGGNLPASMSEAIAIQRDLNRSPGPDLLSVSLRSRDVTCRLLSSKLPENDLFHYAGHSEYDPHNPSLGGLLLADGKFEVKELLNLARQRPLPPLVFANACQSGRTEGRISGAHLFGLASAFLISGVRHYIGSRMDLFDRSSAAFAEEFYRHLVRSEPIGEALRQARLKSLSRYGEQTLTWASYVLYGDPSFRYFPRIAAQEEEVGRPRRKTSFARVVAAVAVVVLLVGGLFAGKLWSERRQRTEMADEALRLLHTARSAQAETLFRSLESEGHPHLQGMALLYLNQGDAAKAEEVLSSIPADEAERLGTRIVRAHLALSRGNLEESEATYLRALEDPDKTGWQQAECHFGLGRIYMRRGAFAQAAEQFDRAIGLEPTFVQAFTARGLVLDRMGRPQDALEQYEKAAAINGDDRVNGALYRRAREHLASLKESERRAKIDALISDLAQSYREGHLLPPLEDEWSSRPLHLFFLESETKGQPEVREGEDAYLAEQVLGQLSDSKRFGLVERALLDRLLDELKLSSSDLADPQTALRLGKILSARVLATATFLRYRGQLQATVRAIDTETTRIVVAVSGISRLSEDPAGMLETLMRDFQEKLASAYPIRGRVMEPGEGEVLLNIGSATGLAAGMKLSLVEAEGRGVELQVKEVRDQSCTAAPAASGISLQKGWRVQEKVE